MADPFSFPDIAALQKRRAVESTTSANVGVYERPLGGMVTRTPNPQMPGNADSIETPQGQFFDAEEYLRRVGLR